MNSSARWVALATAIAAAGSFAVAVTTPPRSGPNCRGACIGYPYTDAAAFVPRDYLWMYPATLACLLAVGLAVCVHAWVPADRRALALAGVAFATMGAGALVLDYGVQLTVVQPALLNGETEGLSVWSQYDPHGVFIALENVGYAVLSLALLLLGLALRGTARSAAWVFIVAGAASLVLLVVLGAGYGARLDYRYEVFSFVLVWLALIAGPLALASRQVSNGVQDGGGKRQGGGMLGGT